MKHFTINNAKNRRYITSPLLFILILHYHNHKPKIYLVKGCSICHALIFFISCNVILSYRTSSAFSNLVLLLSLLAKTPHHRICIVVHVSRLVPPRISKGNLDQFYYKLDKKCEKTLTNFTVYKYKCKSLLTTCISFGILPGRQHHSLPAFRTIRCSMIIKEKRFRMSF